jgi:hypothetical protein
MAVNPWLLGGIGLLFGVGVSTVREFENAAAKEISDQLQGVNKKVKLSVTYPGLLSPAFGEVGTATIKASDFQTEGLPLFTEPQRSKKGSIKILKLELTNFYLRDLRVESLISEIPDCRFDFVLARTKKQMRLSKSGLGTGTVILKVKDLAPYILKKYAEIKQVTVNTEGDWIRVAGNGQFLIFNASFDIRAKIATDGGRLYLRDCIIRFDGKEPDEESKQALLNTLNPVVDFAKDLDLYDAVFAKTVELKGEDIIVKGTTKVPIKPD